MRRRPGECLQGEKATERTCWLSSARALASLGRRRSPCGDGGDGGVVRVIFGVSCPSCSSSHPPCGCSSHRRCGLFSWRCSARASPPPPPSLVDCRKALLQLLFLHKLSLRGARLRPLAPWPCPSPPSSPTRAALSVGTGSPGHSSCSLTFEPAATSPGSLPSLPGPRPPRVPAFSHESGLGCPY